MIGSFDLSKCISGANLNGFSFTTDLGVANISEPDASALFSIDDECEDDAARVGDPDDTAGADDEDDTTVGGGDGGACAFPIE